MDERESLKRKVDGYLTSLGPLVFFEKRSPSATESGVADYTGCAWGRFFAIELKHPVTQTQTSMSQKLYMYRVTEARGNVCVARSVQDVATFMADLAKGT